MEGEPPVAVLRLGHRPGRDNRMTTHVALTARALGADEVFLPSNTTDAVATANDVTNRFGGPFSITTVDHPRTILQEWTGAIIHLTMYGERVETVLEEVQAAHSTQPVLIVVGAEKVAFDIYETADWNIAVTNQPHSEVAALAVFLDRLFEGREFDRDWIDATQRVHPKRVGKHLEDLDERSD